MKPAGRGGGGKQCIYGALFSGKGKSKNEQKGSLRRALPEGKLIVLVERRRCATGCNRVPGLLSSRAGPAQVEPGGGRAGGGGSVRVVSTRKKTDSTPAPAAPTEGGRGEGEGDGRERLCPRPGAHLRFRDAGPDEDRVDLAALGEQDVGLEAVADEDGALAVVVDPASCRGPRPPPPGGTRHV